MNKIKRKIALSVLGLCTLIIIGLAVYVSYDLDYYHFYAQGNKSNWVHPTSNVLLFCAFIIAESVILAMIIIMPKPIRLWARGMIGLIILIPWVGYSTMFVIHMPGYILLHHLWAWLIGLLVFVMTLSSAAVHIISIIRQRAVCK